MVRLYVMPVMMMMIMMVRLMKMIQMILIHFYVQTMMAINVKIVQVVLII